MKITRDAMKRLALARSQTRKLPKLYAWALLLLFANLALFGYHRYTSNLELKYSSHNATMTKLSTSSSIDQKIVAEIKMNEKAPILLPNVLLIGVQEAGSDNIADWLLSSGKVCGPKVFDEEPRYFNRQVHFFDQINRYEGGMNFYALRFQHCSIQNHGNEGEPKIIVDATPNYFEHAQQIHEFYSTVDVRNSKSINNSLSSLKFILVLREPISREFAEYQNKVRNYLTTKDTNNWFSDVANTDGNDGGVLSFPQYASHVLKEKLADQNERTHRDIVHHLQQWTDLFDRQSQILILSYDELLKNSTKIQWRLEEFLGFKFKGRIGIPKESEDSGGVTHEAREILRPIFAEKNNELYGFLERHEGPPMEQRPFPAFVDDANEAERESASVEEIDTAQTMPKILWMYWEQGLEHLQSLAGDRTNKYSADARCVEATLKINTGWDVKVLSRDTISKELAPIYYSVMHNETLLPKLRPRIGSDLLRLELLSRYGGVWQDTSICPFVKLDSFIPAWLGLLDDNGSHGFFARPLPLWSSVKGMDLPENATKCHEAKDLPDQLADFRTAASWFLAAATPHNELVDESLKIYHHHLIHRENLIDHYFLMQCTMTQARAQNSTADAIWSKTRTRWKKGRLLVPEWKTACYDDGGQSLNDIMSQNCAFVKKQVSNELLEYVFSEQYINDVVKNDKFK